MTDEEIHAWAKSCADVTRGRVAEFTAWDVIAERGHAWEVALRSDGKPFRGGPMMTLKMCFSNATRIALGLTSFDPSGCLYAEGFALGVAGLWFHHAWVVNSAKQVIERTWRTPGARYVGVTFEIGEMVNAPGLCQLSKFSLGTAVGPHYAGNPEVADLLWGGK